MHPREHPRSGRVHRGGAVGHTACRSPHFIARRRMRIAYVTETYPPELNGVSLTVERTVRHLRRAATRSS